MALLQHNWRDTGKKNYQLTLYESQSNYYFPAHRHKDQAELVYCTRGEFTHRIGGVNHIHRQGEMRLIDERDIHMLRGDNFSYFNLAFHSLWLERIAHLTGREKRDIFQRGPGGLIPVSSEFQETLDDRLERLFRWEDRSRGAVSLTHLLTELIEIDLGLEEGGRETDWPDWLSRSVSLLNETLSMDRALEVSCRSREHFIRTFKKHLNMTPVTYLNQQRLEKASRLLVRTNLSVKSLAGQCGFENQNYFNRLFKDKFTMTPMEFRRRYLNRVH